MNLEIYYIFFFVALQRTALVQSYEYCGKNSALCKTQKHIVCTTKEELVKLGGRDLGTLDGIYYNTQVLHEALLGVHNAVRNDVAGGVMHIGDGRSRTASRMREMTWDLELAYTAQLHASKCVKIKDCHNTERFEASGQNLLVISFLKNLTSVQDIITEMRNWTNQHMNLDPDDLIAGIDKAGFTDVDEFVLMVNEQNTHVGCAMVKCVNGKEMSILLTCNYSHNNLANVPIYEYDEPKSDCKFWDIGLPASKNYPHLCAPTSG